MAAPELSCFLSEFKSQLHVEAGKGTEYFDLGPSAVKREHEAIGKTKAVALIYCNPLSLEVTSCTI